MELCDPKIIELLMDFHRPARRNRMSEPPVTQTQERMPVRRCTCGECLRCADNARWERIYQEKFADPFYYITRPVRHMSSLDFLGH